MLITVKGHDFKHLTFLFQWVTIDLRRKINDCPAFATTPFVPNSSTYQPKGYNPVAARSLASTQSIGQGGEKVVAYDFRQPPECGGVDGRAVKHLVDVGAAARHLPCEPRDGEAFFGELGTDEAADV